MASKVAISFQSGRVCICPHAYVDGIIPYCGLSKVWSILIVRRLQHRSIKMTFDLKQYLERIGLGLPVQLPASATCGPTAWATHGHSIREHRPTAGPTSRPIPRGNLVQNHSASPAVAIALNLTAYWVVLGILGFRFVSVLGRVRMGAAVGGPRTHLAHLVEASGQTWLCDAGFGGPAPAVPISLDAGTAVATRWKHFAFAMMPRLARKCWQPPDTRRLVFALRV